MLYEYVLATVAILSFLFAVITHLKKKKSKILEHVYNPMETAITKFHIDFEKDKLNTEQQFRNFETAYFGVKHKYGNLIDGKTDKYIGDLYRANEVLNNLHNDENFGSFEVSIILLRDHLGKKKSEINKKSMLRFFII